MMRYKKNFWPLLAGGAIAFACPSLFAQEPVVGVPDPAALFTSRDHRLHANKQVVLHIVRDLLEAGHWKEAPKYLTARYLQHNPNVASGLEPVMKFFADRPSHPLPERNAWHTQIVSVVAEGNLVVVATVRNMPAQDEPGKTYTTTWFDMWRIQDGKADEHWDGATLSPAPPKSARQGNRAVPGPVAPMPLPAK